MHSNTTTITLSNSKPSSSLRLILSNIQENVSGVLVGHQIDQNVDPHAYLDAIFLKLQNISNQGMQELKLLCKSKIPKEPKPEEYTSDQAYSQALQDWEIRMANYKQLLAIVKTTVEKLTLMYEENLKKIQEFYENMWEEIKKGNSKEAKKKMDEFNRKMAWNFKQTLDDINKMAEIMTKEKF